MNLPVYPHASVANLSSLALALGLSLKELHELASTSDDYYFLTRKIEKPDGSLRLTYDAQPILKAIHGKISEVFLKRVDYPRFLQGSIKKRDYISDAKQHVSSKMLISEDITNFFPSISKKVVHEVWVGVFGFSNEVADLLAELVTYQGYVVQGSKTSSYICNLVLWKREAELVSKLEAKGFTYTRYVDDVTVSTKRIVSKAEKSEIINSIYSLFRSVGAKPNRKKHKVMPRNNRQEVHGVNVNKTAPTMPKKARDQIRAAVHQCELAFGDDPTTSEYQSAYSSAMGRVNTMGRMHEKEARDLRARLAAVKPVTN
ncbi:hypothetical protein M634_19100 [Vibrio parahaemolyticus O1:Kuk str. FDA_R31]|uniref:reverse transcriptase family protein n=1 Tax=Vibrio harveyi group TaxID=717610 RepID=UPI0003590F6E|nr:MULTISPECIES: reverse transcriptase family protein [Vibrio harveyi group]AGQ93944.1 hypothetical protein M634_19100 [Vibrio parahaemolyticus O1:Kuk str. FDA_R31]EJB0396210.1 RNA-directed DNA polymerase [Vibrio parahaemolyticus]EJB5286302.1 RNA-directed DNA polymerase [Vibrio parahaemolyticus]EJG2013284.1 RNA-directed DNA polymerase [Vibrio parahaemolyticus]EJG2027023.1 RNA-directed DNA polymerase [Vibrio parahaemolyticus]